MKFKQKMDWRKLNYTEDERKIYYSTIIKPLIWEGLTYKKMQDRGLILCSYPTAKQLTREYGTDKDLQKAVENQIEGKKEGGRSCKGKPSPLKGRKYEDYMDPETAANKKAQASEFWKRDNPRKYFTGNNISKGQQLLYEKIKEVFPTAIIEHEVKAPGKTYYLDVAVPELKLDFEYDGFYWHSFPDAIERDAKRDEYLQSQGWKVFRYSFNARNDLEVREELSKLNLNLNNICQQH
jgi:very-short-patch-repair endonuclease